MLIIVPAQHLSRCNNNDFFIINGVKLLINIKIDIIFYEQTFKHAPKHPL